MWRRSRGQHHQGRSTVDDTALDHALERLYAVDPTPSSSGVMDGRFEAALAAAQAANRAHRHTAVAPVLLVLMAALLLGATYAIATAMSQAQPGALGPGGALHCSGIADLAPAHAARKLDARGYRVSYRDEQTTSGRFGISRVTDVPPPGVITDIVIHGDLAIVFVSPVDDPLADRANRDGC